MSYNKSALSIAWVNFAGSSGTIGSSYNVSSVTHNSTGNYTIVFQDALNDANYAVAVSTTGAAASNSFGTLTTTSCVITTYTINSGALGSVAPVNPTTVSVVFFD